MNLLNNKDLLRGLLLHADLANTINGGISQTNVQVTNNDNIMLIRVSAPAVHAEAFNIILNYNKLTLFSELPQDETNTSGTPVRVPMFIKTFNLPATVDTDKMEAFFEAGELKIILPHKPKKNMQRRVNIKNL
jgi:HSP20 family protein